MGLNVLSESASDPQMNLTQLMDGVTTIEHSMGLAPFHDDVVQFWRGTTAGMTPTLVVVYNGFPPEQILEIATIRGAEQHGLDAQIGSVEVGKLLDLIVLDANPPEDIGNAARIRLVMKGGVVYSGLDAARVWPDPSPASKPYSVRGSR